MRACGHPSTVNNFHFLIDTDNIKLFIIINARGFYFLSLKLLLALKREEKRWLSSTTFFRKGPMQLVQKGRTVISF